MVKRKTTEVLISGKTVDPHYKVSASLDGDDPMKAATRVISSGDQATARIRQRQSVIDKTLSGMVEAGPTGSKDSDLASLEEELGMPLTADPGEGVSRPMAAKTPPVTNATKDEAAPSRPSAPKTTVPIRKKNREKPLPLTPKELSREKASSTIRSVVEQMKAKAESNGGFLRTEDIAAMEKGFQTQVADLAVSLESAFDAYAEARERAEWDIARGFPFGRVIVKSFSHLFKEPAEGRLDTVSKRMLPGFFSGLNMMIGPESVDLFEERCLRVVELIREQEGDAFDWDSVYASKEIKAIVIDALMTIAPHFDNFERRQEWFIDLVNSHLGPEGGHGRDDAGWELTPAGYKRFLAALYADTSDLLAHVPARDRLSKRHGDDALKAVIQLIERSQSNA